MLNRLVRRWILLCVVLIGGAVPAHAGMPLILPRPGQIGFTLQGQYGDLLKSGLMGNEFGSGAGLAVRLRYRMRFERALGLSFESQKMDVRGTPVPPPSPAPDTTRVSVSLLLSGAEFYQLFNTDQNIQEMVSIGAGLAQVHYALGDGDTEYPLAGDGLYLSAGFGLERFFYRSFAFDVSTRYLSIFHDGHVNHDLQASVGIIFYASY